jgi:hypothetical protein
MINSDDNDTNDDDDIFECVRLFPTVQASLIRLVYHLILEFQVGGLIKNPKYMFFSLSLSRSLALSLSLSFDTK